MPRPHTRPGKPYRWIAPLLAGPLVGCALLLGGCDAIYDDTKGWANRLEASILDAAHKMGEPTPEEAPAAVAMPASETPPAVPVETVDTAALPAPPPAPAEAPEGPEATEAPALSAPGVDAAGAASGAPDGLMAEAAKDLSAAAPAEAAQAPAADPAKNQAKLPPKPLPKPQRAAEPAPTAVADAAPASAAEDPAVAMVLHLSSLRSEEAAKREWSDLQRSFPEPLGQMQAEFRRTELGDKGTYYRVLAGPLPSRDAARQVCDDLKAKKARQYCRIVPSQPQAQPQAQPQS